MQLNLKYSQYNERSILIEWPAIINQNILKNILDFKNRIQQKYIKQKVEVVNTYNSILVIYDYTIEDFNGKVSELEILFNQQFKPKNKENILWEIPVCYDEEFGLDLEAFSITKGLSKSEIIKLHSESIYTVFFIGFLPGFLYLGGLNPKLFLNRKTFPKLDIKKGAVAIGGQQTGIYPQDSPGGWHIIGGTPINLFNPFQTKPCFASSGDKLKFIPIGKLEYSDILSQVKASNYQLKSSLLNA